MPIWNISHKGAFTADYKKLKFPLDLGFSPNTYKGEDSKPMEKGGIAFRVAGVYPTAELYRFKLDDGRYLDALRTYPHQEPIVVGIGRPDEERGDGSLIYEDTAAYGKPLSEFAIGGGVVESRLKEAWESLLKDAEDGIIEPDELNAIKEIAGVEGERPSDYYEAFNRLKEKMSKKEFAAYFGKEFMKEIYANGDAPIARPKTLKPEEAEQTFTLNATVVGQTQEGDTVVYHLNKLKEVPSTYIGKALKDNPDYQLAVAATAIRMWDIQNKEKSPYMKKLAELKDKASPNYQKLAEIGLNLKAKDYDALKKFLKKAREAEIAVLKRFDAKTPIVDRDVLVEYKGRKFLRSISPTSSVPLVNLKEAVGIVVATVPRPIQVEGKWRISKVGLPTALITKTDDGKYKLVNLDSDRSLMAFGYPIYKALAAMAGRTKPSKGEEWTWKQIRALSGQGFEINGKAFLGLKALEEKFSNYKGLGSVYAGFVRHILTDVLKEELFTADEGNEEAKKKAVREKLLNNPVIKGFLDSFEEYLKERRELSPVSPKALLKKEEDLPKLMGHLNRLTWRKSEFRPTFEAQKLSPEEKKAKFGLLMELGVVKSEDSGWLTFDRDALFSLPKEAKNKAWEQINKLKEEGLLKKEEGLLKEVQFVYPKKYDEIRAYAQKHGGDVEFKKGYNLVNAVYAFCSYVNAAKAVELSELEGFNYITKSLRNELAYYLEGNADALFLKGRPMFEPKEAKAEEKVEEKAVEAQEVQEVQEIKAATAEPTAEVASEVAEKVELEKKEAEAAVKATETEVTEEVLEEVEQEVAEVAQAEEPILAIVEEDDESLDFDNLNTSFEEEEDFEIDF